MLRVLIVEDHIIIGQGLKQFVENASNKAVMADMCAGQEATKIIHKNPHDVVLIGTALSEVNSIELLKQIRAVQPNLPVLILSGSDEEQYCGRLLRAGA